MTETTIIQRLRAGKAFAFTAMLLVPLFAASVFAATESDYDNGADTQVVGSPVVTTAAGGSGANPATITYTESTWVSTQDWCTVAVDNDGPGNQPPFGIANTCDNDSTNTATQVVGPGYLNGSGPLGPCSNGGGSVCFNGFTMFADTADGDGRFGGDYPNATSVTISANPATRFVFQVGYRDTQTGVFGFTGLSLVTCVGDGVGANPPPYTIALSLGGLTDPPAGNTIDSVKAVKATGDPLCVGSNGQVSTVTGTWNYQLSEDDSTVNTSINVIDIATASTDPGTCAVTFSNSASVYTSAAPTYSRYGAVDSQVMIGPTYQTGSFHGVEGSGATVTATGTVLIPMVEGTDVIAVTSAWAIGASYKFEATNPVFCTSIGTP